MLSEELNVDIIDGRRDKIGDQPVKVLIDVFRSTSTIPLILNNGAKCVIPSRTIRTAMRIQKENPGSFLVGERFGVKVPGFDYCNSPYDVWNVDFKDKIVSFTSTNGTLVLEKIKSFPKVFIASFVNHEATIRALQGSRDIQIVMSGRPDSGSDEDLVYAEYLKSSLLGKKPDTETFMDMARRSSGARRLAILGYSKDVDKCLSLDHVKFPVVLDGDRIVRS